MANNQGKINFQVGFNVDRSGLNGLKQQLQELQNLSQKDLLKINSQASIADLQEIQKAAAQVQKALEDSFNPKLNTTDLTKFKKALGDMGIDKLKASFDKAGQSGVNAFRNVTTEILTTNRQLKESNKWLDKMAETMANTVRWSIASSALNAVTQSIQKAWSFTKQLDSSLNDIQIVTQMSADQMDRFAVKATKAAQALGATTRNYSDAALIYYQQGLSDQEVEARSNVTVKVANVTGQSAQQVSEQLTAVWNGYKVSAEESEKYIDKLSAVARTTAADLEELSTGMSKVASAANSMGVDIDSLNAQLATIVSVTREAPESIGTALKTVYARMSDIEAGLDTETTLGEYTSQMAQMGVNVLDAEGNLRDMGAVVEEIGNNWDNLNRNQQVSLAQTIAGTRQYSRMIALFDNWDMYQSAKTTSVNSTGDLQKQQDIYLESMEAHLNELTAEAEELYQTLMDPEGLNPLIDTLTTLVGLGENIIESIGGGAGLLMNLGSIGLNVFGNQITKGITTTIRNIQGFKDNMRQAAAEAAIIQEYGLTNIEDERTQKIIDIAKERLQITDKLSEEERQISDQLIRHTNELYKQQDELNEQKEAAEQLFDLYGKKLDLSDTKKAAEEIKEAASELVSISKNDLSFFNSLQADVHERDISKIRADKAYSSAEELVNIGDSKNTELFNKLFQEYENQTLRNAEAKETLIKKEQEYEEAAKNVVDTLIQQTDATNEVSVASKASEEQKAQLKNILEKVLIAFDKEGNLIAENADQVKEAAEAVQQYNKIVADMQKEANDTAKSLGSLNSAIDLNERQIQEAEAALDKLKENFNLTEAIGSVTDLLGNVVNIGTAISNIGQIPSIWNNDDLTTGEKILQTMSSLAFTIPMLTSGFKNIKKNFTDVIGSIDKALDIAIAKQDIAIAKNKLKTQSEKESATANLKNAGSNKFKDVFGKGGKFGEWFKGGGGKAIGNVAGYAGAIALVVAATAAAINITKAIDERAQREFESAKQEAEMLASEAERAEFSYEELSSSIDSLEDNQDNLKKLTKGTLEWKEALYEVNQQVLDLIAKYPELMQYMSTDEDGVMSISQEGLQKVQEEQFEEMKQANAASIAAQNRAKRAEIEVQKDRFAEQAAHGGANQAGISGGVVGGAGAAGGIVGGILAATASGAAAGSIAPGIGTLIGAAVGIAVGAVGAIATNAAMEAAEDKYQNQLDSEAMDKVVEAYQISGESMFKSSETLAAALGKDVSALSSLELALLNNKDETIALIESMANLEATNRALAIQMGATFVGDDATEGEKVLAGNEYDRLTQEYLDKYKANAGGNTQDKEEAIRALELMGLSAANLKGAKGKNMIQYIDEDGNEKEMTMDQVYAKLADADARKEMESRAKEITAAFDTLDKITLKNDNIKNYISSLGQDGFSLASATFEELMEMDALELNPEQLQKMAEIQNTTADELIEQFNKAVDDAITANKEAAKNWEDDLRYSFALNFGDIGLSVFNDLFSQIGNNTEKLHEFYDAFKQVTWTDDESVEEFRNALIELFGEESLDLIDNFISLSKRNQGVRFDIKKAQEGYSVVNKVLESLEKAGDTISAEDWESLPKYLQEYFVVMADGTYALIEDAKTLKDLFGKEYFTDLEDQINTVRNQIGATYEQSISYYQSEKTRLEEELKNQEKQQKIGIAIENQFRELEARGANIKGSSPTDRKVEADLWADTNNHAENYQAYVELTSIARKQGVTYEVLDYLVSNQVDAYTYLDETIEALKGKKKKSESDLLELEALETFRDNKDLQTALKDFNAEFDTTDIGKAGQQRLSKDSLDKNRAIDAIEVAMVAGYEGFLDNLGDMSKEEAMYKLSTEGFEANKSWLKNTTGYQWIEKLQNGEDLTLLMGDYINRGLEYANKQLSLYNELPKEIQEINNTIAALENPELSKEEREKLEIELKNLQTQYAASAGSRDKFLQAIDAGIITDKEIIKDYDKYYTNLAKSLKDINGWNIDAYEEINRQLERAQHNYDALTEAQDKLTGETLLNNLKAQNEALIEQIGLQKEKAKIDQEEISTAKKELTDYLNSTLSLEKGFTLEFNESGYLNASQLYEDIRKNHREGTMTKEDQDKIYELVEAYNKTIDAAFETKNAIKELIYNKLDINAQKIEVELEFSSNLKELAISYNEFLNDIESGFGKIDYAKVLDRAGKNLTAIQASIDAYEKSYHALMETEVITPSEIEMLQTAVDTYAMTEEEMNEIIGDRLTLADKENQLQNIRSGLMDEIRAKQEEILSIEENYSAALDEINSKYEKQISLCETMITLNEDLAELTSLLGEGEQSAAETQATSLGYMKQSLGVTIEQFNTAKAEYDKLQTDENYKALTDERKQEIIDSYIETAKATTSSLKDITTAAYELFKTSIEEDLTESLYGTLNTTLVDATAEWAKSQGETYLDAVDTAYELDKIAYKYDEILTSLHGNAAAQQIINTARQRELELLEAKGRLTKDDLDRAQKALDLEMARIALEEAQANKTQMRLVRGANGAYSYQYTADLNNIAEKEQKVKDTENALINANQKLLQNSITTAEEARKNWQQAYIEAAQSGDISIEEKAYLAELEEDYRIAVEGVNHYLGIYADSLNMSEQELLEYLRVNESSAEGVSVYQVHMIEKFQAGADAALAEFEGKLNSHKGTLDQTLTEIEKTVNGLDLNPDTSGLSEIQTLVNEIKTAIFGTDGSGKISGEFKELGDRIAEIGTGDQLEGLANAKTAFDELVDSSKKWLENIDKALKSLATMPDVVNKNEIMTDYFKMASELERKLNTGESITRDEWKAFRNLATQAAESESKAWTREEQIRAKNILTNSQKAISETGSDSIKGNGKSENENEINKEEFGTLIKTDNEDYYLDTYQKVIVSALKDPETDMQQQIKDMFTYKDKGIGQYDLIVSDAVKKVNDKYFVLAQNDDDGSKKWKEVDYRFIKDIVRFDTGGYTGTWGDSSGRMAMLDKKELILNKTDTKNILDVIDIVRQLDISMLRYTAGLSQIKAGITSQNINNQNVAPVQQQIQINAEFPNAEKAEEIREAFNQLFNLAEQYAHEDPRF